MVGTFYSPNYIINVYIFIDTLDDRQLSNGFAEIIKIAMVFDNDLYQLLKDNTL